MKKQTNQLFNDLPDFIPSEAWEGYLEMRKSIKKPPTEYAVRLLFRKLAAMKQAGQNLTAVLEQSIINNWTDVYPVKRQSSNIADRAKDFMDKLTGKKKGDDDRTIDI